MPPRKIAKKKIATPKTSGKKVARKVAKTTGKKTGKKTSAAKSAALRGQSLPREMNEHGFVIGSESEKIVNILLEGDESRVAINNRILKELKKPEGTNISSLVANLLKRLYERGYTVEQSWVLVEPTTASKAAATRKAKKKAATEDAAPAKRVAKKRAGKKTVARKGVKKGVKRRK